MKDGRYWVQDKEHKFPCIPGKVIGDGTVVVVNGRHSMVQHYEIGDYIEMPDEYKE